MALRKIHNTYYVYFRDIDGKIKTRSLKTTDKDIAEKYHRLFMRELQSKKSSLVLVRNFPERFPNVQPVTTIAPPVDTKSGEHQRGSIALARMWDLALTRRALSVSHKKVWDKFIERIKLKFADQVTPQKALDYLEKHYSRGNGKTFNNVKSALNTIFRCCLVEAGLQQSPFAAIINKRVTEINHHRNLKDSEIDLIFDKAPIQLQIAIMLSRWTAQRLETVTRMTPEMFDFDKKVFIIDPGKNRRFKEWVCCPIMPQLERYIKPILAQCKKANVPIVKNFSKWVNDDYTHKFTDILREMDIPSSYGAHASFHSLRGTAITWFKEHGIKGEELRSITGHDSYDVEDIYARDIATVSRIAKSFCEADSV